MALTDVRPELSSSAERSYSNAFFLASLGSSHSSVQKFLAALKVLIPDVRLRTGMIGLSESIYCLCTS
jgi:hypothetical protein